MNVRQKKRWIQVAAAAVTLCAAGVLAAGIVLPVHAAAGDAVAPPPTVQTHTHAQGGSAAGTQVDLSALLALCQRPWRKPLFAEAAADESQTDPAQPPQQVFMNLRLIGTAIETGHSMALFQKPDNTIEVCPEGGVIEVNASRVNVEKIAGTTVTVQCGGQRQTLTMPKPPEAPQP